MKSNVLSKLWNKVGGPFVGGIVVLVLVLTASFLVGNPIYQEYQQEIAACQGDLATCEANLTEITVDITNVGQPTSPIEWMEGYVEWDEYTTGDLKSRPWSVGIFEEGGEGETIVDQVVIFVSTLDNPAEPTYIVKYRGIALVELKETLSDGTAWWSLLFVYTEDGWLFVDAEVQMLVPR